MKNLVSGTIVKVISHNIQYSEEIGLIIQPYNNKFIVAIVFDVQVDFKGNPLSQQRIIYKEYTSDVLVRIEPNDELSDDEDLRVQYLKNHLLTDIRKRKMERLKIG